MKLLKNDELRTAMGKVDNALSEAGFAFFALFTLNFFTLDFRFRTSNFMPNPLCLPLGSLRIIISISFQGSFWKLHGEAVDAAMLANDGS